MPKITINKTVGLKQETGTTIPVTLDGNNSVIDGITSFSLIE